MTQREDSNRTNKLLSLSTVEIGEFLEQDGCTTCYVLTLSNKTRLASKDDDRSRDGQIEWPVEALAYYIL
jgi:hypothetical protein